LRATLLDNLVRPLVLSGVLRFAFLLVLFGVLGGLAAFGLMGLFVGPVIPAILVALWRAWADTTDASPPPPSAQSACCRQPLRR
jgi:predicted PurR-regulated permease PerM